MSGEPLQVRLPDGTRLAAWSRAAVAERLAEAARTLKALPSAGCFPRGYASRWPALVRGFWETWNAMAGPGQAGVGETGVGETGARRRYAAERLAIPAVPGAGAIDRMDAALAWLGWIADRRKVRVVWALALGVRPAALARSLGLHRNTVATWQRESLEAIARRLNAEAG